MTEKRWLYFALGITTAISIGAVTNQLVPLAPSVGLELGSSGITFPDGTVQTSAARRDPRLSFYVTDSSVYDGLSAPEACGSGFHMAQLWEILDPSNLRYAIEAPGALEGADGPIPTNYDGWVRTGGGPGDYFTPGLGSCNAYTENTSGGGTLRWLPRDWSVEASELGGANGWLDPWTVSSIGCSYATRVWCVEDYPGAGDCQPEATAAVCQDGLDNDCDSYVDCDDWDCGPFCS